jgi:hypothetical protein
MAEYFANQKKIQVGFPSFSDSLFIIRFKFENENLNKEIQKEEGNKIFIYIYIYKSNPLFS